MRENNVKVIAKRLSKGILLFMLIIACLLSVVACNQTEVTPSTQNVDMASTKRETEEINENEDIEAKEGQVEVGDPFRLDITYDLATDEDFKGSKDGEFLYVGDKKFVEIPQAIKGVPITSYNGLFASSSVEAVKSTNKNVTNMSGMFRNLKSTSIDLYELDTSSVTDMALMFEGTRLNRLDLRTFDTSNVTDMGFMFSASRDLTYLDISNFNTAKVKNMSGMFQAIGVEELDITHFDTKELVSISHMFSSLKAKEIDLSNFDTSNVKYMEYTFAGARLEKLDLSNFNTSKVETMQHLFEGMENIKELDLSGFDFDSLDRMYGLSYIFDDSNIETVYVKDNADAEFLETAKDNPEGIVVKVK